MIAKFLTIKSKDEGYAADVFRNDNPEVLRQGQPCYFYKGDFDVDVDGSPGWRRDPFGQADTTLHHNGKPINSDEVCGIVLPPECILAVKPKVLGCHAQVSFKGRTVDAVVFDVGPHRKLGEGSAALARALGIDPDPNRGGWDYPDVTYRWWPGVAALVGGIVYNPQSYRS